MTPTENNPTTENTVEQINIISGITVKGIGCNPKAAAALEEGDKREIMLGRFLGQVTGLVFGEMPNGDSYIGLLGRFQATNMQEDTTAHGVTYESGKCFLPPGTHESIIGRARKIGIIEPANTDKRSKTIEKPLMGNKVLNFALDIAVKRAANASGITYVSKPLLEATEADPMRELRQGIATFEAKLKADAAKQIAGASGNSHQQGGPVKQIPAKMDQLRETGSTKK